MSDALAREEEMLWRDLGEHASAAEAGAVRKALEYARRAHEGQARASGEPYLVHCVAVTRIVFGLTKPAVDLALLQASLLHDALEDDPATSLERLRSEFGADVVDIVDGVTKIANASRKSKDLAQRDTLRKMLLSMSRDLRVIILKLSDRLHNMRTLDALEPERRKRIATETRDVYAPLAHLLGILVLKEELEDLAFRYLQPAEYAATASMVAERKDELAAALLRASTTIKDSLTRAEIKCRVEGRVKSLWSIHGKMEKQEIGFDDVFDLLGVRVIVAGLSECYLVLGVLHNDFEPLPERLFDYIGRPRSNGYQSLHTTLLVEERRRLEVQIRTQQMHYEAEVGVASHFKYKDGGDADEEVRAKIGRRLLNRFQDWQQDVDDPGEFMDFLRVSLYQEEVFVFTPKGELKQLPRGATPLDFAYAVHSQVGHHCVGARVNGRLVPLRHELMNGDTVEIMTSASASPSEDWLHIARSSRARGKIRHWITAQRKEEAIVLGRELLQRELRKKRKAFPSESDLLETAQSFGLSDAALLYAKVGEGALTVNGVLQKIYPELAAPKPVSHSESARESVGPPVRGISIQEVSSLLIHIAQCCQPVPGDAVVGLITRGRGLSVHRQDCPNTFDDRIEKERKIEVRWDVEKDSIFLVRVAIFGEDRTNLLADVALAISATKTNIKQGMMGSEDARAIGDFLIEVRNLAHLEKAMREIRKVKGVTGVERKQWIPQTPREEGGRWRDPLEGMKS